MVHNINLKQIMRFWNQRYTSSTHTYLCSKWIKYSWKLANNNSILVLLPSSTTKCMYTPIQRVFLVYWKSKETSVILWLYDFFWQFEQYIHYYYSIISKCNKTYSRTTAIIFQRVVKRETSTTYTYYGITMLLKIDLSFKKVWLTFLSLWTRLK